MTPLNRGGGAAQRWRRVGERDVLTGYRAAMAYTGLVLSALALAAVVAPALGPALRFGFLLLFVCLAPGAAVLSVFRLGDRISAWALAFVLSLAVTGVVADVMLWTKTWRPAEGYFVLIGLSTVTAVIALWPGWRSGRRTGPAAQGRGSGEHHDRPTETVPARDRRTSGTHPHQLSEEAADQTTVLHWWDEEPIPGVTAPAPGAAPRPDETAVLPAVRDHALPSGGVVGHPSADRTGDETAVLPRTALGDETVVFQRVQDFGRTQSDETTVLKRIPGAGESDVAIDGSGPRSRIQWRSIVVEGLLFALVLGLWGASIAASSVDDVGEYGLLSVMNPTFLLALLVCAARFVAELSRDRWRGWVLLLHTGALLLIMHATVPLLVYDPEYAWSYKHVGVIEHFRAHGEITNAYDVYQQWPTLFAVVAHLVDVSGLDALRVAAWAPLFFDVAFCVPVFAIAHTLARDPRVPYLTVFLFTAINWVGQDYLAPQAYAFILCLGAMLIMLRWLRRSVREVPGTLGWLNRIWRWANAGLVDVPYTSKNTRRAALAALYVVYAVVVSAHQLSPYVVAMGACALALLGLVRPLQIVPILLGISVLYLVPRYEIAEYYGVLEGFSIFSFFDRVGGLNPIYATSPGRILSAQAVQFVSLSMWGLTAVSVLASFRRLGPVAVPAVLAFSPFGLLLVQSYGGEAIYRVFLFSAPWCALLISTVLLRQRWLPRVLAAPLSVVLLTATMLASIQGLHGQLTFNKFTRAEVEAAQYIYTHAEPGSDIVLAAGLFPTRLTGNYDQFNSSPNSDAVLISEDSLFTQLKLGDDDMPAVNAFFEDDERRTPKYLVFSPVMERYMVYFGYLAPGTLERLEASVSRSPKWTLVYENEDVTIFRFIPDPP